MSIFKEHNHCLHFKNQEKIQKPLKAVATQTFPIFWPHQTAESGNLQHVVSPVKNST